MARAALAVRALLLGLAVFWPVSAAASIASVNESRLDALALPAPPSPLDDLARREQQRAACGVFCGAPLTTTLDVGVGRSGRGIRTQDAWGNYRFPQELTASRNRYGFTGYLWDAETELYYAKARYFDPQFGRFLTQDSLLGDLDQPPSLHRYLYAAGNPTRYIDLNGFAYTEAEKRQIFAGVAQRTGALNNAASQVAAPITRRLEGVTNLVLPVSYLRDSKGEDASFTRRVQYSLIDQARDRSNSTAARWVAGLGAAAMQPGAALNDIAHGLAGVPGQLGEAGSHVKRALQAESGTAAALELTEAVEKTAGAVEMTVGAILLTRGAARAVEEGRAGRAKMAPAEGKEASAPSRAPALPDEALVCRAGECTAERFANGSGVWLDEAGRVHDVSVNSGAGQTVTQLTTTLPRSYKKVGVSTAGDIRRAGGRIEPDPLPDNPYHCLMCDATPETAEQLFTPARDNPSYVKPAKAPKNP